MPEKEYTRAEVAALNGVSFIIDNEVYNVSGFLDEHPGGHEVLQAMAGKDASEDFHDVGHSIDAKELMGKWRIGVVTSSEHKSVRTRVITAPPSTKSVPSPSGLASWHLPVLVGLIITLLYYYLIA